MFQNIPTLSNPVGITRKAHEPVVKLKKATQKALYLEFLHLLLLLRLQPTNCAKKLPNCGLNTLIQCFCQSLSQEKCVQNTFALIITCKIQLIQF